MAVGESKVKPQDFAFHIPHFKCEGCTKALLFLASLMFSNDFVNIGKDNIAWAR